MLLLSVSVLQPACFALPLSTGFTLPQTTAEAVEGASFTSEEVSRAKSQLAASFKWPCLTVNS